MTTSQQEHDLALHARQYRRLLDVYGIPEERRIGWLAEMADAFAGYEVPVVVRATDAYIKKVAVPADQYHEVPTPGTFAEWVYKAADDAERDEQKALPPPAPSTQSAWERKSGADRAAFLERHMAIGVLKGRGHPEPSEQDIAGAVGQLRAKRFCATTLDRIAAGETVTPADLIAAGAPRKAGRPITEAERASAYQRRGLQWPGAED